MTSGNYIGLSDDRLRHMRQVGERCIEVAEKLRGTPLPLEEQKRWFITGFLHDVGYRFSINQKEHPTVGAHMLHVLCLTDEITIPISEHGRPGIPNLMKNTVILNIADMTTSNDGKKVSFEERMAGIEERYGKESEQYVEAEQVWTECAKWIVKNTEISSIDEL